MKNPKYKITIQKKLGHFGLINFPNEYGQFLFARRKLLYTSSSRIFNLIVSLPTTLLYYKIIKYFIINNLMFLGEDVRIVSANSFFNKHPIPFNILENGMYLKFTNFNKLMYL